MFNTLFYVSIRLPESHGLLVDSITEYGNERTKCQYVHEMPIRSRLTDGHSPNPNIPVFLGPS